MAGWLAGCLGKRGKSIFFSYVFLLCFSLSLDLARNSLP
jgi:hypothetical protein